MIECPKCHTPIKLWQIPYAGGEMQCPARCGATLNVVGMVKAHWLAPLLSAVPLFVLGGGNKVLALLVAIPLYLFILNWLTTKTVTISIVKDNGHSPEQPSAPPDASAKK